MKLLSSRIVWYFIQFFLLLIFINYLHKSIIESIFLSWISVIFIKSVLYLGLYLLESISIVKEQYEKIGELREEINFFPKFIERKIINKKINDEYINIQKFNEIIKNSKKFHFLKDQYLIEKPIDSDDEDLFHTDVELRRFIKYIDSYKKPLTVGIYDSWGSGKSSFINLLSKRIDNDILIFQAWKYKNKSDLWRSLILKIAKKWDKKEYKKIERSFYSQVSKNKFPLKTFISLISISFITIYLAYIKDFLSITEGLSIIIICQLFFGIIKLSYYNSNNYNYKEYFSFEQFEDKYKKIVEKFKEDKYIVIDDLDRCNPKEALSLLEDLSAFLKQKNSKITFIIPLDYNILREQIRNSYKTSKVNPDTHIDKIIDLPYYLSRKTLNYDHYIEQIISKDGNNILSKDYNELNPNNEDLIQFLSELFRKNQINTLRKIKKIFQTLDFTFNISENKEDINSIILLIIIILREKCPKIFEGLISFYDLNDDKEIINNKSKTSNEEEHLYFIYKHTEGLKGDEISYFNTFNAEISSFFTIKNPTEKIMNIIPLKKKEFYMYINSLNSIRKEINNKNIKVVENKDLQNTKRKEIRNLREKEKKIEEEIKGIKVKNNEIKKEIKEVSSIVEKEKYNKIKNKNYDANLLSKNITRLGVLKKKKEQNEHYIFTLSSDSKKIYKEIQNISSELIEYNKKKNINQEEESINSEKIIKEIDETIKDLEEKKNLIKKLKKKLPKQKPSTK